jgi:predicted DNA-binding transcriptional regulator YafY
MSKQVERRAGSRYKVSPFQLLINDGNYYLVAYADYAQEMRTYRVDRIKDIRFTGEPRDGDEAFSQMDVKSYANRVFSMVRGDLKLVEMHFSNVLLDAVVDRFGTKYVQYAKVDEEHFSVTAKIEISSAFYGWLLGFGDEAKLVYPEDAVDNFRSYLRKVGALYES